MRIASHLPRLLAAATFAAGMLALSSVHAAKAPVLQPDKLVILSTTDVKGKANPCGCSTPKGGLSRRASYVDSVKASYGQVLVVDNGGFFPEEGETHKDLAAFFIDAMKTFDVDVVNIGERDLKYGREFLQGRLQQARLPVVSANLLDAKTRRPLFTPYVIKKVGRASVGVFGLITNQGDLGPSKDQLAVADPLETAKHIVPEIRRKGAQVIVLLSQLGKVESEDLVSAVEGIDAIIVGRNVLMVQKGRMVNNTVACYGGEQGQYACRTELTLDPKGRMASGEAEAVMLGPAVGDKPSVLNLVKSFEEGFNIKLRKVEATPSPTDGTHQVTAPPAEAPGTAEKAPTKSPGS